VTGGKLTTFGTLAKDALTAAKPFLPGKPLIKGNHPALISNSKQREKLNGLSPKAFRRLYGRYGEIAERIVKNADPKDLLPIPGTFTLWAELPVLAGTEQVRHLTDLLLRRVRIGLLTPNGGREFLDRVQMLCENSLPWDHTRWQNEKKQYIEHWENAHSVPI